MSLASLAAKRRLMHFFGRGDRRTAADLLAITQRCAELSGWTNQQLQSAAAQLQPDPDVVETFALSVVISERVLGLKMFDVQILGALALQRGEIAEMQTGEGKTLAAVPAIVWYALHRRGVHVLTANDYLARRDCEWMGEIFRWFSLSVGYLSQAMPADQRRCAYQCDITYATANEVGFDHLRDSLALCPAEIVQRSFAFAVIDEADSILIDEARIPLVIAGGVSDDPALAYRVDAIVLALRPHVHFVADEYARNVRLTDSGIRVVETRLGCGNLFEESNLRLLTAVQDALHAHVLLRRDVDYVVKRDEVEIVDEFKGRVAQNRRWPAGLHSAIEAKERVALKNQGRILGSITVQNLVGLYVRACGMTGTAATQADEFYKVYKLPVTVIPPNRPVVREDLPDILYADKQARNRALLLEVRKIHATGRPVLVGTGSVRDSEQLSRQFEVAGIPHAVLNARNDQAEAEIVAQAGSLGAVTISTNMAGRGTDILLGGNPPRDRDRVLALGGLYVIGTTRHEARRIDHQLRGRAGRQGDPGSSRFFLSLDDDLLVRFGIAENPDVESVQRTAESQNLEIREMLWKYESVLEHHRREVSSLRRAVLLSSDWSVASLLPEPLYAEVVQASGKDAVEAAARPLVLATLDDLWADYLANVTELRGGVQWVSWGGRDPLFNFLTGAREIYADFQESLREEVETKIRAGQLTSGSETLERGATWTYLTSDQPFGSLSERILKGFRRELSRRAG